MSDEAKDLLRGLLERIVATRTGSGSTGSQELKRSRFFKTHRGFLRSIPKYKSRRS